MSSTGSSKNPNKAWAVGLNMTEPILGSPITDSQYKDTEKWSCTLLQALVSFSSRLCHVLSACACACVDVYDRQRGCIRISSPGTCDQPNPPKILTNATIFAQPALACAPCYTPNTADVSSMISKDNFRSTAHYFCFEAFLFFFFSMWKICCCKVFVVTGNGKWKSSYSSYFQENGA